MGGSQKTLGSMAENSMPEPMISGNTKSSGLSCEVQNRATEDARMMQGLQANLLNLTVLLLSFLVWKQYLVILRDHTWWCLGNTNE